MSLLHFFYVPLHSMSFVDVILPLPLDGLFTYAVPAALQKQVQVGVRVVVPFGRSKTYVALVARLHDQQPEGYEVKPISSVEDSRPVLLPQQLRLWQWMSDYYLSPIGEVMKAALPSGMKAEDGYRPKTETFIRLTKPFRNEQAQHVALNMLHRAQAQLQVFKAITTQSKALSRDELMNLTHCSLATINALVKRGILETYEQEVGRLNHGGEPHPERIQPLSEPQADALNRIKMQWMKKQVVLLHGVTGSGKTEIYIHLIQQALDRHEQVLYLMPEIALTVQMMQRLQRVFGNRLGIYHSKYSDAERVEIWQKQLSTQPYDIILGARSAVFLPFQHLGLVIVDEEHESSFKQQDPMPRYHARDVAVMLSSLIPPPSTFHSPQVLLGTATPSMESYYNTQTGKYGLVELKERYRGMELPEIQIVDVKDLRRRKFMTGPFSPVLVTQMREALARGEQIILFQNRRGFAPMIECKQCGWVPRCEHCDVSLTLHRSMSQLTCHYCGYTYRVPTKCPACEGTELFTRGYGTEKIEDQICELFPEAHVARMDLDTTRSRHAYERIISDFASGKTNVLIGTQMVTKGLDFDRVSVVGILDADAMLNQPDFRAWEHAFMMMAQVSGRAGRKGRRGLVLLQTKSPDLPLIHQVVTNNYEAFYKSMLRERRDFHYPPLYRLIYVYMKHKSDDTVSTAAIEMGSRLRQWFGARVLGPDKPAVAKVKQQNIRKIVLKLEPGINMPRVRQYLCKAEQLLMADKRYSSLQIYFDVDPL